MSKKVKLRVCASCEWIFKEEGMCPKCGFASYGARYVYGNIAYTYAKTQEPWKRKKMKKYEYELDKEINKANEKTSEKTTLAQIRRDFGIIFRGGVRA